MRRLGAGARAAAQASIVPQRLQDTAGMPWVVSGAGSPCREPTEHAWRRAGLDPVVAAEATDTHSRGAVAAVVAALRAQACVVAAREVERWART